MLAVHNLGKHFVMHIRGGVRIPSFSGVSFEARPGALLALTGPSGTGKSSLLKCIYRTYLPSSGRILYRRANGEEIDLAAAGEWDILALRRTEIGYVSQFFQVMPRTPALEILMEPLVAGGLSGEEARDRAETMLARVGLERSLWEMYPSTFSGGEKQRLNLLRAVIAKPRLLLLDEPTASLDRGHKGKIMDMILDLKAEGTAMIGVFHDRDALLRLSDARYDLRRGGYCEVDAQEERA
jgi:alpha-D-ribose 1-methylphosphonate 5-triphosphate synthase subunit PhnL